MMTVLPFLVSNNTLHLTQVGFHHLQPSWNISGLHNIMACGWGVPILDFVHNVYIVKGSKRNQKIRNNIAALRNKNGALCKVPFRFCLLAPLDKSCVNHIPHVNRLLVYESMKALKYSYEYRRNHGGSLKGLTQKASLMYSWSIAITNVFLMRSWARSAILCNLFPSWIDNAIWEAEWWDEGKRDTGVGITYAHLCLYGVLEGGESTSNCRKEFLNLHNLILCWKATDVEGLHCLLW